MENKNYQELLLQLENAEIDELKITPDEFMTFQPIYMNYEKRKRVVGKAGHDGVITYRYVKDDQN